MRCVEWLGRKHLRASFFYHVVVFSSPRPFVFFYLFGWMFRDPLSSFSHSLPFSFLLFSIQLVILTPTPTLSSQSYSYPSFLACFLLSRYTALRYCIVRATLSSIPVLSLHDQRHALTYHKVLRYHQCTTHQTFTWSEEVELSLTTVFLFFTFSTAACNRRLSSTLPHTNTHLFAHAHPLSIFSVVRTIEERNTPISSAFPGLSVSLSLSLCLCLCLSVTFFLFFLATELLHFCALLCSGCCEMVVEAESWDYPFFETPSPPSLVFICADGRDQQEIPRHDNHRRIVAEEGERDRERQRERDREREKGERWESKRKRERERGKEGKRKERKRGKREREKRELCRLANVRLDCNP